MEENDYLGEPNKYEILELWMGLPFKEKITIILKQFFPEM